MRIGELAQAVGVSADTVRFYERSGWLPRPSRRDNDYRDYGAADAEHLRLLIELRRLDVPLEEAANLASMCHSGHCAEMSVEMPRILADRRAAIAERISGLRALDARLASVERHFGARDYSALMLFGRPCCDAAGAVLEPAQATCACCAPVAAPPA